MFKSKKTRVETQRIITIECGHTIVQIQENKGWNQSSESAENVFELPVQIQENKGWNTGQGLKNPPVAESSNPRKQGLKHNSAIIWALCSFGSNPRKQGLKRFKHKGFSEFAGWVQIQENKDWNFMALMYPLNFSNVQIQENKDWNKTQRVHRRWCRFRLNPRKQGLKLNN